MKRGLSSLGLVLAITVGLPMAGNANAQEAKQAKPTPSKTTILASKLKLEKARDAMRSLADMPAPKGLTPPQLKTYGSEMQKVRAAADSTDVVIKKIDKSLSDAKSKAQLDELSELSELESLRLQMAMDRLSKMYATLSNLLKKQSDTAQSIIHNLK